MTILSKDKRFSDDGETIYEFSDKFLVVCPRCESLANVIPAAEITSGEFADKVFAPRKLICLSCVHRDEWRGRQGGGGIVDLYFQLPLWLQISCCGETLWAYNRKHLEFVENYVGAKLRARTPNINKSLASRLPSWIKQAKNRDEILKGIAKLRGKLNGKS